MGISNYVRASEVVLSLHGARLFKKAIGAYRRFCEDIL